MLTVSEVKPLKEHKLLVKYNDNQVRLYDFEKSSFFTVGTFRILKRWNEFKSVSPFFDTVHWGCGLCISAEELYKNSCPYDEAAAVQ